jgi:hypothetical protein
MKMNYKQGAQRWTLVAAGMLGVAGVALAQNSPYAAVRRRAAETTAPVYGDPTRPADAVHNYPRLAEVKAELAWLGNPATFPCSLEARAVANTALEVHGVVPNELTKKVALMLARDASGLRVVDNVIVNAHMPMNSSGRRSTDGLQRSALDALEQTMPQYARGFTVNILTNGQVLLRGAVPSLEDKLSASRCLRELPGCACVMNQLLIKPVAHKLQVPVVPIGDQVDSAKLPNFTPASDSKTIRPTAPETFAADTKPEEKPLTLPAISPVPPRSDSRSGRPVSTARDTSISGGGAVSGTEKSVTNGVVFFEPKQSPLQPKPVCAGQDGDHLRKRIAVACGKDPADIEVTPVSEKNIRVRVKVISAESGDLISTKIFQIPELAPYEVSLEISVPPSGR